jgi:hypothetical protein
MLSKLEEMKTLREEATNLHLGFLQGREKIKPLYEEISKCIEQRKQLFDERHGQFEERKKQSEERKKQFEAAKEETEKQKKAKEQEIKEKIGSQAREKLERGEELDLREFQTED